MDPLTQGIIAVISRLGRGTAKQVRLSRAHAHLLSTQMQHLRAWFHAAWVPPPIREAFDQLCESTDVSMHCLRDRLINLAHNTHLHWVIQILEAQDLPLNIQHRLRHHKQRAANHMFQTADTLLVLQDLKAIGQCLSFRMSFSYHNPLIPLHHPVGSFAMQVRLFVEQHHHACSSALLLLSLHASCYAITKLDPNLQRTFQRVHELCQTNLDDMAQLHHHKALFKQLSPHLEALENASRQHPQATVCLRRVMRACQRGDPPPDPRDVWGLFPDRAQDPECLIYQQVYDAMQVPAYLKTPVVAHNISDLLQPVCNNEYQQLNTYSLAVHDRYPIDLPWTQRLGHMMHAYRVHLGLLAQIAALLLFYVGSQVPGIACLALSFACDAVTNISRLKFDARLLLKSHTMPSDLKLASPPALTHLLSAHHFEEKYGDNAAPLTPQQILQYRIQSRPVSVPVTALNLLSQCANMADRAFRLVILAYPHMAWMYPVPVHGIVNLVSTFTYFLRATTRLVPKLRRYLAQDPDSPPQPDLPWEITLCALSWAQVGLLVAMNGWWFQPLSSLALLFTSLSFFLLGVAREAVKQCAFSSRTTKGGVLGGRKDRLRPQMGATEPPRTDSRRVSFSPRTRYTVSHGLTHTGD